MLLAAAAAGVMLFVGAAADARVGNGASSGSRGLRTLSVPPTTRAAPKPATQINRPAMQTSQAFALGRPAGAPPAGVLNRPGLLGGVAAGFFGAGLFGLFVGNGAFSGLGGIASIIGLILQIALVVLIARLLWMWWRRSHAPAFAGLSPRELADVYGRPRADNTGRAGDTGATAGVGTENVQADQHRR